jgi:hypothetical protein
MKREIDWEQKVHGAAEKNSFEVDLKMLQTEFISCSFSLGTNNHHRGESSGAIILTGTPSIFQVLIHFQIASERPLCCFTLCDDHLQPIELR